MSEPSLTEFLLARYAEREAAAKALDSVGYYPESDQWPSVQELSANVLADCEAKRRIVEWHRADDQGRCVDDHHYPHPCPTLAFLALPYADHPDYRDEFRP